MDVSELTRSIKEETRRLGFLDAGVAPASALTSRRADLLSWIRKGYAGPLAYMQNFLQRQGRFLERATSLRSILVVAAPYPRGRRPDLQGPDRSPFGRIARYAVGRDYHRVISKRLKKLESFVRVRAGRPVRIWRSLDTGPVQEKALGEAAGLGFFGKNGCLIRPKGGSYFFLAALLMDLELAPDQPLSWDCGSCNLCLEACPTQAIPEPYQVDANRCISSLTIELKGPIPLKLRPLVQDWVFGCDVCQEVCPYNRRPDENDPGWTEFEHRNLPDTQIPLERILSCRDDASFREMLQGSPLMRAKREGLLRNAAIAAGNLGDKQLAPALTECLRKDPSALVRSHAAWALEQLDEK